MVISDASPPSRRRRHVGLWILGSIVVAVIAVVALWDWDWFLPMVDSRATATLGRKVTAQHLHVHLGRVTTVVLDNVEIANADGFDDGKPFAHVDRLTVLADVMAYIHTRQIVIPQIMLDHPVVDVDERADKTANWPTGSGSSEPAGKDADPNAGPKIGQLVINDGHAHVVLAPLKANFDLAVATKQGDGNTATPEGQSGQIVVDAKGTYAAQPIIGKLIGGAALSLRDTAHPYPVDLHVENGPTKVALTGTVQNPLNFAGADLTLDLTGPNMELLTPVDGGSDPGDAALFHRRQARLCGEEGPVHGLQGPRRKQRSQWRHPGRSDQGKDGRRGKPVLAPGATG